MSRGAQFCAAAHLYFAGLGFRVGLPAVLGGIAVLISTNCSAGEADVTSVSVECDSNHRCSFDVTVSHADTGWQHYADHWRIVGPDGAELGRRVLLHPHETEQPFTRSLNGVAIPAATGRVTIQAHDSEHGYGGVEQVVTLP